MPRQSYEVSIRDLVKVWPRAKVGVKMAVNFWERFVEEEDWEKKLFKKVYSNAALSMRAMLKCRKGVSRWWV